MQNVVVCVFRDHRFPLLSYESYLGIEREREKTPKVVKVAFSSLLA